MSLHCIFKQLCELEAKNSQLCDNLVTISDNNTFICEKIEDIVGDPNDVCPECPDVSGDEGVMEAVANTNTIKGQTAQIKLIATAIKGQFQRQEKQ